MEKEEKRTKKKIHIRSVKRTSWSSCSSIIRVAISANEEGEKHRVIQPRIFTLFCSTVHLLT